MNNYYEQVKQAWDRYQHSRRIRSEAQLAADLARCLPALLDQLRPRDPLVEPPPLDEVILVRLMGKPWRSAMLFQMPDGSIAICDEALTSADSILAWMPMPEWR